MAAFQLILSSERERPVALSQILPLICPYCDGDETNCTFSFRTETCKEMEKQRDYAQQHLRVSQANRRGIMAQAPQAVR